MKKKKSDFGREAKTDEEMQEYQSKASQALWKHKHMHDSPVMAGNF